MASATYWQRRDGQRQYCIKRGKTRMQKWWEARMGGRRTDAEVEEVIASPRASLMKMIRENASL